MKKDRDYDYLISNLIKLFHLSYYLNSGGAEFIGKELYEGKCQVPGMSSQEDYEILMGNLKKTGKEIRLKG